MTASNHTPLPWKMAARYSQTYDSYSYVIYTGEEDPGDYEVRNASQAQGVIMEDHPFYNVAPSEEDARFIFRACNSHYALQDELEQAALELDEAAKILSDSHPSTAHVLRIAADRKRAAAKGAA